MDEAEAQRTGGGFLVSTAAGTDALPPRWRHATIRTPELVMANRSAGRAAHAKSRKKTSSNARRPRRTSTTRRRTSGSRKWSQRVTRESDALDLERGVFTQHSPGRIAASLKQSAERSKRRKADPYRAALSMLTFYINRAGKSLPLGRQKTLNAAKAELRKQFGRA
jgi:hypothetical protein